AWRAVGGESTAIANASAPSAPTPLPRIRTSLHGRDAEIAQLAEALHDALDAHRAGIVLLRGAAGLGKSRLLAALAQHAREHDTQVINTGAVESDSMRPFAIWLDTLARLDDGEHPLSNENTDNREQFIAALSARIGR